MRAYFLFFALIFLSITSVYAETPITQYNGNNHSSCPSASWTTDLTSAGQTSVSCRNTVYAGQFPPCTFDHVTGLISYGDCRSPHIGITSDPIWTISTRQWCSGLAVVAVNGTCTPLPCSSPSGTVQSSGFFDLGVSPDALPAVVACKNGCRTIYGGDGVGFRRLINGVYHYFARGQYVSSGLSCTNEPVLSMDVLTTLGADSCAPGQQSITMNGLTKCFDSTGAPVSGSSASAVQDAKTLDDEQSRLKRWNEIESKLAEINASTSLTESEKSTARAVAAGTGSGSGSGSGSGVDSADSNGDGVVSDDEYMDELFCKINPSAPFCLQTDFGKVEELDLETKEINVSGISPVNVGGGGGCPSDKSFSVAGKTYMMSYSLYCDFAAGLRPIILAMAWLTAAGILIGGFKTGG